MDKLIWDDLRVLLAVRSSGSLLGAGRLLGMSTSTVGRRIDALEAAVGQRLVHRTQGGTELTAHALSLVQLAEGLQHGLRALQRHEPELARVLRVSVPSGMAAPLARPLLALQREHPNLDVELVGEDQMADMARREADLALRLVRSSSAVLVEKRVATLRFGLYCSTDYARRRLSERRLRSADAAGHSFIGLDGRWRELPHEQWMRSLGAQRFIFRSSAIEAIVEATRTGLGVAALLDSVARAHSDLVRLRTDTAGPVQPLYLVYHRDLRNASHLRAAVRAIEAALRELD